MTSSVSIPGSRKGVRTACNEGDSVRGLGGPVRWWAGGTTLLFLFFSFLNCVNLYLCQGWRREEGGGGVGGGGVPETAE